MFIPIIHLKVELCIQFTEILLNFFFLKKHLITFSHLVIIDGIYFNVFKRILKQQVYFFIVSSQQRIAPVISVGIHMIFFQFHLDVMRNFFYSLSCYYKGNYLYSEFMNVNLNKWFYKNYKLSKKKCFCLSKQISITCKDK